MGTHEAARSTEASLREVIREGRELLKDLRVAQRDASALIGRMMEEEVTQKVREEVDIKMQELSDGIRKGTDQAVEKVNKEFDRLANILLGKKKGEPGSIEDHIEQKRREREANG